MRTINIGIGHNDYLAVAKLFNVEILADGGSQSRNDRHELFIAVNLVDTCLFNVEHFSPKRKYRLITGISSQLCGTTRRISLDDVKLGKGIVLIVAVGKLSGEGSAVHGGLSSCGLTGFLCSLSCLLGVYSLIENKSCLLGIFFQIAHKFFGNDIFNKGANLGISQSALCLSLKLAVGELNGNDSGKTLSYIVADKLIGIVLYKIELLAVLVYYLGKCVLETCFMSTAVNGVDIVCKGTDILVVGIIPLESDLGCGISL